MSYELYLGKGSPSNETSFFEGEPLIARTVSDFKTLLETMGIPKRMSVPYWLQERGDITETTIRCIHDLVWTHKFDVEFPQWQIHADMDKVLELAVCLNLSSQYFRGSRNV